jgi:pilus assembly protein FimV
LNINSAYNLTKILAVLSLLVPSSGYSLGIGDIKLHSALNQKLDAEILLAVSAGDNAAEIKANLAPPSKFVEAGVPWTSFLSQIKVETIVGAKGAVIIKLSSTEPVKEPFLDLLLQVSGVKDSLYREFTVLLDPPPEAYLVFDGSKNKQIDIPSQKPMQKLTGKQGISGEREYGPTNKKDTLWKIAKQASEQTDVSVEQMMTAIYEANPHAFYKENFNALSTGKVLKVPDSKSLLKYSQTKLGQNHSKSKNQLKLIAPIEENVAESANIALKNEQITAENKDDFAASAINNKKNTNDALQSKVTRLEMQLITRLEKELVMMQQIVELKDQQIAILQSQLQKKSIVKVTSSQADSIKSVPQQPAQPDTKLFIEQKADNISPANSYFLWAGIGTGVLSLIGLFWWQRRKLGEQAPVNFSKTSKYNQFFSALNEKYSAKNIAVDGTHPFVSDAIEMTEIKLGGHDTVQGEIDPIVEANVYLLYGQYQQAEMLMAETIKDQPDRDDCKLKLLEIYYLNKNKHAFETYAYELANAGKKSDVEFWGKVDEMRHLIGKDSALSFSKIQN